MILLFASFLAAALLLLVNAADQQQYELVVTLPVHDASSDMGLSHAGAVLMALQHAQDRDPSVISAFAQCPPSSSTAATSESPDNNTTNSNSTAIASWNVTFLDSATSTASLVQLISEGRRIDALIGGYPTAATFESDEPALSQLATQMHWPLVLYGGGSERNLMQSAYASRVFPSATAYGEAIVDFLTTQLNRTNYFALLVEQTSSTSLQYLQVLMGVTSARNVETQVLSYQLIGTPQSTMNETLHEIRETGYRTLLFLLDDEYYPNQLQTMATLAAEAIRQGQLDRNYLWVLVGNIDLAYFESAPADVLNFVKGSVVITPVERFMWVQNESFPSAWNRNSTNQMVPDLQRLLPTMKIPNDYYTSIGAKAGSGFIYDAVAALLLASTCRNDASGNSLFFSHEVVAQRIQHSQFAGASGMVLFDASESSNATSPGSRVDYTVPFGAYSVLPNGSLPLVGVRGGRNSSQAATVWKRTNVTLVFSSGSTVPPPLRDSTEQNYLTPAARIWGFLLFGVLMLFLAICALWLYQYRAIHPVRAAQPLFLGILLLGSTSVGFCIITNSFDESWGWTEAQLSAACTTTPWLLICGVQLIYSSLFCKLSRIDKVLQFRRRKVTVGQVIWPMAAIFAVVLILLTAWTAVGGFEWVRTVQNDYTGESSAKCQGMNTVAWFTPICALMALVVVLTAFVVWKTRDIDSAYSETTMITSLLLFQIQLLVVTIPLMILVESKDVVTRYVVHVTIFFLLAASSSGFLIVPRMYRFYVPKKDAPKRGSLEGVRVSGLPPGGRLNSNSAASSSYPSSTRAFSTESQSHLIEAGRQSPSTTHEDMPETQTLTTVQENRQASAQEFDAEAARDGFSNEVVSV